MNIEDLKKKIKKATNNKKTDFQNRGNAFGIAMRLGTEFVAAVLVASFIGFYLDKWVETTPFLMIRRPPRSTHCISSAASDVYKRQGKNL